MEDLKNITEEMIKEAQIPGVLYDNPEYVANQIKKIIGVLIGRLSPEARGRAYPNIVSKVKDLSILEMSSKNIPGGASIGLSISLIKNVLNGRNPYFIKSVLEHLKSSKIPSDY